MRRNLEHYQFYKLQGYKIYYNNSEITISNIAKMFEKIIYNRIYTFIDNNNILSNKQFGFTKNKSTTDPLEYYEYNI